MIKPLHSTRLGSAKSADYHIVFKDGMYRVFDKAGKFRVGFATLPAAQTYIDGRAAQSHNLSFSNPLEAT